MTFTASQKGLFYIDPYARLREMISPLAGIQLGFEIARHIDLLVGFKFENVGYQTRVDIVNSDPFIQKIRYSKFCFPAKIGFIFGSGKFRPAVYAGFVHNNIRSATSKSGDMEFNLFEAQIRPERSNYQFLIGLSAYYDNFVLNTSYSTGKKIEWGFHDPGHHDRPPSGIDTLYPFRNGEYCISVNYFFTFKMKEAEE